MTAGQSVTATRTGNCGVHISDRHFTDPRRAGLSIDAAIFEIFAHQWLSRHGTDGHLTHDDLTGIAAWPDWQGWTATEMREYAGELYIAGVWEWIGDDDASEGWYIAAPTIRYWHEGVPGLPDQGAI